MIILEERLPVLETLVLDSGSHPDWEHGACVMEAVSYIAGEPWSDAPACASRVITSFLVSWNDSLPADDRQMLKPLIPLVVGTRTTKADDETRAWMCTDWLARECAPAYLRLAELTAHAETLEALAPLMSAASARTAQGSLNAAKKDADAARAAAWDAAWAAAWDAAWAAAVDAAWAAAVDAAWAAAKDVAAQGGGYSAQYAAAYKAAVEVFEKNPPEGLVSVTKGLQASAYQLVERMCAVGREEQAA